MKAYKVFVHLADDEWNNETMERVAREIAAQYADKRPLIVRVYEHGGWWLSYLFADAFDAAICGTANDQATLDARVRAFGDRITEEEVLADIRRKTKRQALVGDNYPRMAVEC